MIPLSGKFGSALITIDNVEEGVISQTISMLNTEPFTNPVRIMPDTHEGKGSVIGLTVKLNGKVCPNTIGVDIGCGMTACETDMSLSETDFTPRDKALRKRVPLGFNIHTSQYRNMADVFKLIYYESQKELNAFTKSYNDMMGSDYSPIDYTHKYLEYVCKKIGSSEDQVKNSCGTLGGGNHFIEIDVDDHGKLWSVVHSGSRNFGLKVANYHQKKAGKSDLAFLEGENAYEYFIDMIFAQQFASMNRKIISDAIAEIMGCDVVDVIESIHNFVDPQDMIVRKGAIRSYRGEKMVIPFNMRDGTIICLGKSNEEWNCSAPHGAGRVLSRNKAKRELSLEKYQKDMEGIQTTSVCAGTLDESPDCYKDYRMIMDAINPTATVLNFLKPVYNLKG
jgi:RNA-splicing ligase RtcB